MKQIIRPTRLLIAVSLLALPVLVVGRSLTNTVAFAGTLTRMAALVASGGAGWASVGTP